MEEMMRGVFGGMLGPGHPIFENQPPQRPLPPQHPGGLEEKDDASAGSRDFMLKDGYVRRKDDDKAGKWEDGEVSLGDLDKMEKPAQHVPAPFRGLFSADPFFHGQVHAVPMTRDTSLPH